MIGTMQQCGCELWPELPSRPTGQPLCWVSTVSGQGGLYPQGEEKGTSVPLSPGSHFATWLGRSWGCVPLTSVRPGITCAEAEVLVPAHSPTLCHENKASPRGAGGLPES